MSCVRIASVLLMVSCTSLAHADDWDYSLTPYVWAAGLDGTQGFGGRSFEVDAGFGDLVDLLDIGFAAHVEGRSDTWGWFGDLFYVKLSDGVNLPARSLDGETTQTIFELGLSYRFSDTLEGLAGIRNQDSELEVTLGGVGSLSTSENWTDGFIGFRWTPVADEKWQVWLRGDVGAGESDLVWLTAIGAGYRFNARTAMALTYRYLDTDYENDGFEWNVAQSGLLLGLEFAW